MVMFDEGTTTVHIVTIEVLDPTMLVPWSDYIPAICEGGGVVSVIIKAYLRSRSWDSARNNQYMLVIPVSDAAC